MTRKRIRVLVAEDTDIGRWGLRNLLETFDEILLVGETDSAHSIQRLIDELSPNVLLMDLKWYDDEAAGWIKIREIRRNNPKLKIVAITAHTNLMEDAWKAGADQVVTKNLRREELLEVLRNVANQSSALILEPPINYVSPNRLSHRELEVLLLIDKGLTDKEISSALNIEVNTTKNHVKSILQKLGVGNRRKAAIYAREQGIIK